MQQQSGKTECALPYLRPISARLHCHEYHRDYEILNIYYPSINE